MKFLALLIAGLAWGATIDFEGKKLAYTAEGQGKRAIIFVHGWSCNQSFFLPQMEEFRKTYRVIVLDLPGHGKSDSFENLTMDLFARAVEAVRRKEGVSKPILVGHSLGAVVARQHGRLFPGVAAGFVMLDGSIFQLPPDEAGRQRWQQMILGLSAKFSGKLEKKVRERNVSEFLGNMYAETTPNEFRLMVLGQVLQTKPETSEGAMRAMGDLELWDDFKLMQPTLFLRAGRQAPPGEEIYLKGLFPNLRYKFMPGVSHFFQLDKPEETNREIAEFLRSVAR